MTEAELPRVPTIESRVIPEISGAQLERNLLELAKIGGEIREVGKEVAVTRLALSDTDLRARAFLTGQMEEAGMEVEHHPMGLIGLYPGEDKDLPAVMLMSHFDSVPNGGAYDGTVGVISGIELVRILNEKSIKLPRSIMVLAVTAEESSRFKTALLGSKAIFHGLTDPELDTRRFGDQSLREALTNNGFNVDDVRKPRIKSDPDSALIELHISQNGSLEQDGKDLAIIEAIAAPERYEITIGDPIEPDTQEPPNVQYLRVSIKGQSGHSGATPMGRKYRADAMVFTTTSLIHKTIRLYQELREEGKDIDISIGGLSVVDQALNKIPGQVEFTVRVGGKDVDAIGDVVQHINEEKTYLNDFYKDHPEFRQQSVDIATDLEKLRGEKFYRSEDILPRQAFVADIIRVINYWADRYKTRGGNIVGTMGTYNLNAKGQIVLGIDIRGTNLNVRDEVVNGLKEDIEKLSKGPYTTAHDPYREYIKEPLDESRLVFISRREDYLEITSKGPEVKYDLQRLPGSDDPTLMDKRLVALAQEVIEKYNLGSYEVTFSPAGHDTQSAAREGFRTVMIFIPSRNNGASHVPEEYSTPEDLERGTKAIAALVIKLALEE